MTGKYDDIIDLPHHVSEGRPHLSMAQRAAQFSPFAALSGFDAEVKEAGRLTAEKICLSDEEKEEIGRRLRDCSPDDRLLLTVFIPDALKDGGEYALVEGSVKEVDPLERTVVLTDGQKIPLDDLMGVEQVR